MTDADVVISEDIDLTVAVLKALSELSISNLGLPPGERTAACVAAHVLICSQCKESIRDRVTEILNQENSNGANC